MKNLLIALFVCGFATLASANDEPSATKFSCSNVGGTAEWTVYIDLANDRAGFFDNDATVIVPLRDVSFLESNPPQKIYVFEGRDTNAQRGSLIRIDFNETHLSAKVTFTTSTGKKIAHRSFDGCVADDSFEDLAGE